MIRLFITTLVVVLTSMSVFAGSYKMANIVCFVKLADEADKAWEHDFDYYDNMFNSYRRRSCALSSRPPP